MYKSEKLPLMLNIKNLILFHTVFQSQSKGILFICFIMLLIESNKKSITMSVYIRFMSLNPFSSSCHHYCRRFIELYRHSLLSEMTYKVTVGSCFFLEFYFSIFSPLFDPVDAAPPFLCPKECSCGRTFGEKPHVRCANIFKQEDLYKVLSEIPEYTEEM